MAGTFSQIYIQIIISVKNREALIHASWEDELYKYITGIITKKGQKLIAINGMPDHVHILIGMKPTCCLSDLMREIKKSSNTFIKEKKFVKSKFEWTSGFGSFSYSHSALSSVVKYINNQKEHHKKVNFREEYKEFLEKFEVDFDERYLL